MGVGRWSVTDRRSSEGAIAIIALLDWWKIRNEKLKCDEG
jgi:hypothetical protein